MYIKKYLGTNNWKIPDFIKLIIIIQSIFILLTLLSYYGVQTGFLYDIIGFLLILIIPGFLIVKLMNLDRLKSNGQILLFTVGLTLVSLMLIGFLMNLLYPYLGINKPLSSVAILITLNLFILVTLLIVYLIDKSQWSQRISKTLNRKLVKESRPNIDLGKFFTPSFLLPFSLPILSILGAYAMNVYHSNILTIIMILLIATFAFLVSLGRLIPAKVYPLLILLISISLLFHKSLITNYIWGWDINFEYFLANQVILNSIWNESLPVSYNSMLSVMILVPIFNSFINIGLVWIMKVVYPLIFSLVPLGLYYVFCKQTSPKIAFLASFFFMIQFTFYTEMLTLLRQQVAELMLVLVLMIIINTSLDNRTRSALAIIFGMSIVVAHYGLATIMMIILILSIIILHISEKEPLKLFKNYCTKLIRSNRVMPMLICVSSYFSGVFKTQLEMVDQKPTVSEKIEKYQSMERSSGYNFLFYGIICNVPFNLVYLYF